MLDKSKIKNIVQTLVESKKLEGAALGAQRQAQTADRVRKAVTADMEKVAPGATDKAHAKVVNHFQDLRDKIQGIIDHPATTPVLKKRLISARAVSRIDDVIRSLTKDE